MRLGTFLLGGICGAAAIVYLNKKTRSFSFRSLMNTGSSVGKAVSGMMPTSNASKSSGTTTSSNKAGLDQVERIVNEDPELKNTVNEIMAGSGNSDSYSSSSITV